MKLKKIMGYALVTALYSIGLYCSYLVIFKEFEDRYGAIHSLCTVAAFCTLIGFVIGIGALIIWLFDE